MGQGANTYSAYYTFDQWQYWQDQWELIDGVPYSISPGKSAKHQEITQQVLFQIKQRLALLPSYYTYFAIGWKISSDTIVMPDVLILDSKPSSDLLTFPPVVIFEISSIETKKKDTEVKFELYQKMGVKYYVIITEESKALDIYKSNNGTFHKEVTDSRYNFQLDENILTFDFSLLS